MLRLTLVRHAKSDYPPGVNDHNRPLNGRGRRDAPVIGTELAAGPTPDLVLVSTATRAQQTWSAASMHLPRIKVINDGGLYLASAGQILAVVAQQAQPEAPTPQHVVVVAHNPGLEELALWLAAPSDDPAYEQMALKFPTSAIATLAVSAPDWQAMSRDAGSAELIDFTVARG